MDAGVKRSILQFWQVGNSVNATNYGNMLALFLFVGSIHRDGSNKARILTRPPTDPLLLRGCYALVVPD
jgi:hypothetical protein